MLFCKLGECLKLILEIRLVLIRFISPFVIPLLTILRDYPAFFSFMFAITQLWGDFFSHYLFYSRLRSLLFGFGYACLFLFLGVNFKLGAILMIWLYVTPLRVRTLLLKIMKDPVILGVDLNPFILRVGGIREALRRASKLISQIPVSGQPGLGPNPPDHVGWTLIGSGVLYAVYECDQSALRSWKSALEASKSYIDLETDPIKKAKATQVYELEVDEYKRLCRMGILKRYQYRSFPDQPPIK